MLTQDQLRTFVRDAVSVQYDLNGVMQERAANVACHVKAMAEEIERLRDNTRYWSYCTRQGMLRECPEKETELREDFTELGCWP